MRNKGGPFVNVCGFCTSCEVYVRSGVSEHVVGVLDVGEVEGVEETRRDGAYVGHKEAAIHAGRRLISVNSGRVEVQLAGAVDRRDRLHIQKSKHTSGLVQGAQRGAECGAHAGAEESQGRENRAPR